MNIHGINDVYGVGELEAAGGAVIEAHEHGHDLGDWRPTMERMHLPPGVGDVAAWCGSFARPAWRLGALAAMP